MKNSEYHAKAGISKSDLDLIHRSLAHYKYAESNPREQTDSMLLGSVMHKLVLEPDDFGSEFAVAPLCNRRTKEGKAEFEAFMESLTPEITAITQELYDKASAMADAVKRHPIASKLLTNGRAEQSFFVSRGDIVCKCRPDWLRNDGIVVDLKSTVNGSPDEFPRHAYNFRYHVQAWWYLDTLKLCGIDAKEFVFITVENTAPHNVAVYAADDRMLKLGETEAMADFEKYRKAEESGIYDGYEEKIHSLAPPAWIKEV